MIPGLFLVRAIQTTALVRTPASGGRGWKTGASGPDGVPQATSKLPGGECEQLPFLPTPLSAPFSTPDTSLWLAANLLPVLINVSRDSRDSWVWLEPLPPSPGKTEAENTPRSLGCGFAAALSPESRQQTSLGCCCTSPVGASVPAPSLTSLGLLSHLYTDGCEMGKREKKASSPFHHLTAPYGALGCLALGRHGR